VAGDRAERKLTTILAADILGYSRLMAADEARTLAQLKAHRKEQIEPKSVEFGGRIVKLMGDGILMEFGSVVDAVNFAVDVQRAMAVRDIDVPDDQRITYRIGINIGDIIVEGDDIYGDGVNVAARLETLAEAGGICVSQPVHLQVEGKVDLAFEDLGQQEIKNIPKPVQVFRVLLDTPTVDRGATAAPTAKHSLHWPLTAGALAGLVIMAGIALWQRPWEPREEPASEASMAFPLPDKPSIAVLPFDNMSDDQHQEYFADGMTEDLITDLSKISGLFVIARNSSFSYKGQQVKARQVAEELGVRYVLEGSVRRAGAKVRINAQLIDATTGGHLWAERYDGELTDVFELQDRVTRQIIEALTLELTPEEDRRRQNLATENAAAHDAYLLGLSHYYRRTPEGFAEARRQFEKAIDLDPDYPTPYAALAKLFAQVDSMTYSRALSINRLDAAARARAELAKAEFWPSADLHVVRSWLALNKRQHEVAISEAERALELVPNDVDALEALAKAQIYAGNPEAGLGSVERVIRQNPVLLARPLLLKGLAAFAQGDLENTVLYMEHAFNLGSEEITFKGIQAAAYALLGRMEEAREAFAVFRGSRWGGSKELSRAVVEFPFADAQVLARLAEGLELAGAKVYFTRDDGGYMKITNSNRLSGPEIEELLSGQKIEGTLFWNTSRWQRQEDRDGTVTYSGIIIQEPQIVEKAGIARVKDDKICEDWSDVSDVSERCSAIFRIPEGNARTRWGDYVIFTDTGPHPFRLVQ
jgi:TolB-like protein/class 3 adenylate cyclase/Flp pilus assembly protein TadD